MLKIIRSWNELQFGQLMQVYSESNTVQGIVNYPDFSVERALLETEQDTYAFLHDFLCRYEGFCAVWIADNQYASALRCELYRDGILIAGLETAPAYRNQGYAKKLLSAVLDYLQSLDVQSVYSHISKKNPQSQAVHRNCGFERVLDYAVFLDGSVDYHHETYIRLLSKDSRSVQQCYTDLEASLPAPL